MKRTMRAPIAPIGWSIALHAVLAGLLYLGLTLPTQEPEEILLPIDAVRGRRRGAAGGGPEARTTSSESRSSARKREAALAEEKRQEEQQQQQSRQQGAGAERGRKEGQGRGGSEAEGGSRRQAQGGTGSEGEGRCREEARGPGKRGSRKEREADLRARLADEETRTSAGFQSLKASYVRAIQAHVEQRWFEPPGVTQGLSCTIYVTQIPGGEVVGMRFGSCNGGAAVRQSIETAVRNASPLPAPPEPALFEREVELVFTPKESRR